MRLLHRHGCVAIPIALLLATGTSSPSAQLPALVLRHAQTTITQSCVIEIPPGTVLEDPESRGAVLIGADHITVRFRNGATLRGAAPTQPWDQLKGIGIRIGGHRDVVIENAHVHGFKSGLVAVTADGLRIEGGDFSDNYRQHLKSTPAAEDGADWLYPHHNDDRKWREEYGGAVCVESSTNVIVRGIRVRRGQNGIVLDRVERAAVYDNDCSFLSGWGLALWRSSHNRISRNAFDFCVRGHVEGVYNRGQDSAGILCFEQSNDNVFVENSVTHGGDGFFGFAGQEAIGEHWMSRERERLRKETGKNEVDALIEVPAALAREMSALGCNRNLLIGNDLSYAPAHGIEMTFSEDNQFIGNRLVQNAICGIWGGYSSHTLILSNEFTGNGGMAYGLERGAINMEHAADNLILNNRFANNKCAVHLWWNNNASLMKFPGVAGNERGVTGNVIAGNLFTLDPSAPFANLRKDAPLIVLQLRAPEPGHVTNNLFIGNRLDLTHPEAVAFALQPGCEIHTNGTAPPTPTAIPSGRILGRSHPVGARKPLRGRDQIIMDDWGPWDHESALLRPRPPGPSGDGYDLFGLRQPPRVDILEGAVEAEVGSTRPGEPMKVTFRSRPGVVSYRARLTSGTFLREVAGTMVTASWDVRFFPWKIDPREDLAGWRRLADAPEAVTATVAAIDFRFGNGGPRDLKLSEELTRRGPGPDRFGLIARTSLDLPKGRWRFRTMSDDGVRVLVSQKPVIENWTWHVPTRNEGVFEQPSHGTAEVVVEYFEIDGVAALQLQIEPAR